MLADAIGPRTRAVVPVHYAGVGCEMDTIMDIAARHDLRVIDHCTRAFHAALVDPGALPLDVAYRAPRVTPKPVVQGLQTAVVAGVVGLAGPAERPPERWRAPT